MIFHDEDATIYINGRLQADGRLDIPCWMSDVQLEKTAGQASRCASPCTFDTHNAHNVTARGLTVMPTGDWILCEVEPRCRLVCQQEVGSPVPGCPAPGIRRSGFALVVTVSLLVLLTVVAIGLLALSSIAVRSGSREAARAEAQANARLALALAIGDLQKELGPDQRISAAARILEEDDYAESSGSSLAHPLWLGCWDSWQGWLNLDGIEETYTKGRESQFRRWLVSHPRPDALETMWAVEQSPGGAELVEMVGAGTLGRDADPSLRVEAPLVPLASGTLAWWVGGENQKTRVVASEPPEDEHLALHRLSQWPGSGANRLEGLDSLPDTPAELAKVPSLPTLGLAGVPESEVLHDRLRGHFHDLTVDSTGVLANVRDGGLKKDLNLLLELDNDDWPAESGDYRRERGHGEIVPIRPNFDWVPRAVYHPHKPNFSSWYELRQYYSLYRGADGPCDEIEVACAPLPYRRGLWGNRSPNVNFHWHEQNMDEFGYTRTPMVTRLQIVFSTRRVRASGGGNRYDYKLGVNPVVTLWNPYNATLHVPVSAIWLSPYNVQYKAYRNGTQLFNWRYITLGGKSAPRTQLDVRLLNGPGQYNSAIVMGPGETRIFSVQSGAVADHNQAWVEAYPGYTPPSQGGGIDVPISGLSGIEGSVEIAMRLNASRHNFQYLGSSHQFYFILRKFARAQQRYVEMAGNPIPDGMTVPVIPDQPGERMRIASSTRVPFASVEYLLKSAEQVATLPIIDANGRELPPVDYRCRSFIHANPVNQRHCHGEATDRAKDAAQYVFQVQQGVGNQLNPDFDPSTDRSYYGSAASLNGGRWPGQPQVVTTELPSVAPTSLASLMHFKLGPGQTSGSSRNHLWDVSPNQMLGIGSSFAHPLLPADALYQDLPDLQERSGGRQFYMERDAYDHAFFLNDALWDGWFCSTLTRQNEGILDDGPGPVTLVRDFLSGRKRLPNPHLRSWAGGLSERALKRAFLSGRGFRPDAWEKISSHLVLDGAFNVNSTSVGAWKALFWGLRDESLIWLDPDRGGLRTTSLPEDLAVVSRFSLPCSPEEGVDAGDPASWLGIRLLTEKQIDRLAEECVRQVRRRGPFINLSDFVNRRLSYGETAICGALQAAIDWDEFDGNSSSPGSADSINGRFKGGDDLIARNAPNDVAFPRNPGIFMGNPPLPHPEAAAGSRFAGIPGYLTQADLLKRLGNMLTPRDDTFRIRACGEARDSAGNLTARAWCEAVVQRVPDYFDPVDDPHVAAAKLKSFVNRDFGRRLRLVSFRWLANEEI